MNQQLQQFLAKQAQYDLFPSLRYKRPEQSHKGSFGTVAILGSSVGMTGAIVLAGMAALKNDFDKVFLDFIRY